MKTFKNVAFLGCCDKCDAEQQQYIQMKVVIIGIRW